MNIGRGCIRSGHVLSVPGTDLVTAAEYLEIERKAEIKSEYIDGRMYAISGASERQNLISLNTGSEIRAQLRGRDCCAYLSDMRVKGDSDRH